MQSEDINLKLIVLVLFIVIIFIILLSSPENIVLNTTKIDTNLNHKTQNEVKVLTLYQFYNKSSIENFPKKIGGFKWSGLVVRKGKVVDIIKPDIFIWRFYKGAENHKSLEFLLIVTNSETNLHNPRVCFKATGWEIEQEDIIPVKIDSNAPSGQDYDVHVNRMIAQKNNSRTVVVWWYMWKGMKRTKEDGLIIRLSTQIDDNETDEEATNYLKEFVNDLFLIMYELRPGSEIVAVQIVKKFGIVGIIINALLFIVPLSLLFKYYWRIKNG